ERCHARPVLQWISVLRRRSKLSALADQCHLRAAVLDRHNGYRQASPLVWRSAGDLSIARREVSHAQPYNVLFLCTRNSPRSIMAEAILNRAGIGKFRAFSAGSQPKGQIHPYAIDLLKKLHYDVTGLRSKSWKEFSDLDAPKLDFVFTVCDNAAREPCPIWPGQPMTAHWVVPAPAAPTGYA